MRDDLFEFLGAQEEGRAAQAAGRAAQAGHAAEQAKRGAEMRSLVDKIKARRRTERQQPKPGKISL